MITEKKIGKINLKRFGFHQTQKTGGILKIF